MNKLKSFTEPNHRANTINQKHSLPAEGFLRIWQIVGGKGCPAILPISKSAWWGGIRKGIFPAPVRIGKRTTVWRVQDIRALINEEAEND